MKVGSGRERSRAWFAAALYVFLLAISASARADGVVQVRLSDLGQDVTKANADALVLFFRNPETEAGEASREVVRCSVGALCDLKPGTYWVDIDSTRLVVETRPRLTVGEDEPQTPQTMLVTLHVTRAARIEIPGARLPVGAYLSAVDEKTGVLHSRKVDGPVAHVRVPGRPVILCGFEADAKPIGCRRVMAKPDETVSLPGFPEPARGRGQLFVGLIYPATEPAWDVAVALQIAGKKFAPDVVTARFTHFYAIWFDVPAGQGTLEVTSKSWTTQPPTVVLVPERRTAAVMKIPLGRKPSLKVALLGTSVLGGGTLDVDLFACDRHLEFDQAPALPQCTRVASASGSPDQSFLFADLTPAAYALRWRKLPFESALWFDMRDGKPRDEKVPVELVELHGRVTRGGKGTPASVHWEAYNSGAGYDTTAGQDGRYVVTVAQKGRYFARVRSEDDRSFARDFAVGDQQNYDIEIPVNRVGIRVVTAKGVPIGGAEVRYEIRAPPPDDLQRYVGERRTDKDGNALLAPLPAGLLEAKISAEGFRPAGIQPVEIAEETQDKEILVTLSPGSATHILIVDSTGAPAVGAQIWSEGAGAVADSSGTATFEEPLRAGAPLVAFDARGSLGFFRSSTESVQTVRIPPSGSPIVVRFLSPDGKPLARKNVFVGVDGVLDVRRVLNQALAAGGDASSLPDGSLRVAGIPAEGVLTICPYGRLDLAITRMLPLHEEIVFTLPLGM